jgi:hypothetical protein
MYRLYIDETGTHDLYSAHDNNNRYLSLTGLIFKLDYAQGRLDEIARAFKRKHIPGDRPEEVVLQRKDIVNKRSRFAFLKGHTEEKEFNDDLLLAFEKLPYLAITVTIDKQEHLYRYNVWHKIHIIIVWKR